jgi:hypothetical protein
MKLQEEKGMRTAKRRHPMAAGLAVIALSILAAPGAKAACGAAARSGGTFAPALGSLQDPAGLDQEGSSERAGSHEEQEQEKNDSALTVLGLWKVVYFSGGVLNDVGFNQFNAGGTELVNDVGALDAGTNFCMGAWKRVQGRTYELVHTFFIFDGSGKKAIAIVIEKQHMTVARDGNTFRGIWTQDNYDFSGNLIAAIILMAQ